MQSLLCSYEVALFRYLHGTNNVAYFLFDSYCRNSCTVTDGEPGFSVLINFDSFLQIERYIDKAYKPSVRLYSLHF